MSSLGGGISRRSFIKGCAAAAAAASPIGILAKAPPASAAAPYTLNQKLINKVIVIGMDGMDPVLMRQMINQGQLPTFKKFVERGSFSNLRTTTPPQSPVAWASFITGADPGVHSIFDFVHRVPETLQPYLSTSRTMEAASTMRMGSWTVPLKSSRVERMRKGVAVWDALAEGGVPSTVIQIPSNYPTYADSNLVHSISGMGTPDLLGTYGTFTMFTDQPRPERSRRKEGRWIDLSFEDDIAVTLLEGPANSFKADPKPVGIELRIERDRTEKVARITIGGERIMLEQGEWSRWVPVKFPMVPLLASTHGMVRFYLQEVHPGFRLYCSPINADPLASDLPISTPPDYAAELAKAAGRFYTQGFPADTKALSAGAFDSEEFYRQSRIAFDEQIVNFEKTFSNFREGLYFFYFSSLDQSSHMLWRMMNPRHPLYERDAAPEVKAAVPAYYREMDYVLSRVLEKEDERTLVIAMSDHGFADFTREFNVSSWLVKEGFTQLTSEDSLGDLDAAPYQNVDWLESRAYVCGINGIYINRKNRDKYGWVRDDEAQRTIDEIIAKLNKVVDDKTGKKVIVSAYDSKKIYTSPDTHIAPDILIGYTNGFRISDEAVLGKFPSKVFSDRTDPWSADHCVDPSVVPGMFACNRPLTVSAPGIWDISPSILRAFGLEVPKEMTGKPFIQV